MRLKIPGGEIWREGTEYLLSRSEAAGTAIDVLFTSQHSSSTVTL